MNNLKKTIDVFITLFYLIGMYYCIIFATIAMRSNRCVILNLYFVQIVFVILFTNATEFSYDAIDDGNTVGPSTMWNKHYPNCGKSHEKQCPVNIDTALAIEKSYMPFIIVPHAMHNMNIQNNGHTVQISFPSTVEAPTITGGPLPVGSIYELAQFHFHWHSETRVNSKMSETSFSDL